MGGGLGRWPTVECLDPTLQAACKRPPCVETGRLRRLKQPFHPLEDSYASRELVTTVPDPTRRTVLATMGALTAAGCVGGPPAGTPTERSPTDRPPTDTSSPPDGTSTGGVTPGVNVPDADHGVFVSNQGTQERTVRVRVVREATGEPVFEETRTVSPNTEREVYNLQQANPDGIESFRICGSLADSTPTPSAGSTPATTDTAGRPDSPRRDCITMRTNACYGTAHVTVQGDGTLGVIYSIC